MLKRTHTLLRTLALFMLTIFMAYYAVISFYAHVHVVNGVMIVHSHPFSGHHEHAPEQALVLHFMSTVETLEAEAVHVELPELRLLRIVEAESRPLKINVSACEDIHLRAPPVLSVFC